MIIVLGGSGPRKGTGGSGSKVGPPSASLIGPKLMLGPAGLALTIGTAAMITEACSGLSVVAKATASGLTSGATREMARTTAGADIGAIATAAAITSCATCFRFALAFLTSWAAFAGISSLGTLLRIFL